MTDNSQTLLYKKITDLTDITESGLGKLFEIAAKRQLGKGEVFLKEGQVCRHIAFVEQGYLRTYLDKDGIEINTAFTFENNFTTNLQSLRASVPSGAVIQAGEPTTLYEFEKDKLQDLYKISPEIESFGRKLLEQLLITQEEQTNLFKLYTATERYHLIETTNPQLIQRVSLSQIASYLGVARETISRIRKGRQS